MDDERPTASPQRTIARPRQADHDIGEMVNIANLLEQLRIDISLSVENAFEQLKAVIVEEMDGLRKLFSQNFCQYRALSNMPQDSPYSWVSSSALARQQASASPGHRPLPMQEASTSRWPRSRRDYWPYNKSELNNPLFKMDEHGTLRTSNGSPVPYRPKSRTPPMHTRILKKRDLVSGKFAPLNTSGGRTLFEYTMRPTDNKKQSTRGHRQYYEDDYDFDDDSEERRSEEGDEEVARDRHHKATDDEDRVSDSDVDEGRRGRQERRKRRSKRRRNVIYSSEEEDHSPSATTGKRYKFSFTASESRSSGPNSEVSQHSSTASSVRSEDDDAGPKETQARRSLASLDVHQE